MNSFQRAFVLMAVTDALLEQRDAPGKPRVFRAAELDALAVRGWRLPDVPCRLKRFKIRFDLPNCHSGPVWLELNHNNEKKQQTHGKDVTNSVAGATTPRQGMATVRSRTHRHASFGTAVRNGGD